MANILKNPEDFRNTVNSTVAIVDSKGNVIYSGVYYYNNSEAVSNANPTSLQDSSEGIKTDLLTEQKVVDAIREMFADASSETFKTFPFFAKGRIDPQWDGNLRPPLIFDGETTVTDRSYPWLADYTPLPGDVVLVLRVKHGWVILGKVVSTDNP